MLLRDLAQKIGAKIINPSSDGNNSSSVVVSRFYAGDKISELLTDTCSETLIVSNIINPHIFRVAELMDVPAICLINNFFPQEEIINAAIEHGTALMVSSVGKDETLSRLCQCLGAEARVDS